MTQEQANKIKPLLVDGGYYWVKFNSEWQIVRWTKLYAFNLVSGNFCTAYFIEDIDTNQIIRKE